MKAKFVFKGGKGSGNFGHSGRPGKRGGSGGGSGGASVGSVAPVYQKTNDVLLAAYTNVRLAMEDEKVDDAEFHKIRQQQINNLKDSLYTDAQAGSKKTYNEQAKLAAWNLESVYNTNDSREHSINMWHENIDIRNKLPISAEEE